MQIDIEYLPYQCELIEEIEASNNRFHIITKGRRVGFTRGFMQVLAEWTLEGKKILWGDTIATNIKKYFDRYLKPILDKNNLNYEWSSVDKTFKMIDGNQGFVDFRSADRPENWEGFGYDVIILNEAGIILKNSYLYTNAVLPMLMDFPNSKLIAGGVPKGKFLKNGNEHPFFTLFEKGRTKPDTHKKYTFSTYANPKLSKDDIQELENEIASMSKDQVLQEIYGQFIEFDAINPFMHNYEPDYHECNSVQFIKEIPIILCVDFNIFPMAVNFAQMWSDKDGIHFHIFDEWSIENSSIQKLTSKILNSEYGDYLNTIKITGDYSGSNKSDQRVDNASRYEQVRTELRIRKKQFIVPPNPTHIKSRNDSNYVLAHFPDFKINPKKCPNTSRDMKIVSCDAFGSIIKRNRNKIEEQADHLDNVRYLINTFLLPWIAKHRKLKK